jgi:hypothetical protein
MAGGSRQRRSEQCYGILVMVGRYSGDKNLGFNFFRVLVLFLCKITGKLLTSC